MQRNKKRQMNPNLVKILRLLKEAGSLKTQERESITNAIKELEKHIDLTEAKLDQTEKGKKSNSNLLEETMTEFEQIKKTVEEQNRQLQIEAALDKVRTAAMGMQEPSDMLQVCRTIADQCQQLGFREIRNVQTAIIYVQRQQYINYQYFPLYDQHTVETIDYHLHPDVLEFVNRMLASTDAFYAKTFEGQELSTWREYRKETKQLPDPRLDETRSAHYYFYSIGSGALGITTYAPLPEDQIILFKRFRNVFELAYRRFVDIELALAQARESRIEVAVEKVRAKALAMHKSEEIISVVAKLRNELIALEIPGLSAATIYLEQEQGNIRLWDITGLTESEDGYLLNLDLVIRLEETDPEIWFQRIWKSKERYFIVEQDKKDLQRTLVWLRQYDPEAADKISREMEENNISHAWHPTVQLEKGRLSVDLIQAPPEEIESILLKMGAAFDLAYKRFLDLQKAEAQTREAKIEASLERVRSKAMSMHSSEDLAAAIGVFYRELESFSITPRRCGVGLLNKETRIAELSTMNTTYDGTSIEIVGKLKMQGHPVLEGVFDHWLLQKEFHPVLKGNEIKEYYQLVRPQISFPDYPSDVIQFGYFFFFPEGGVYAWTNKEMGEEELKIYRRFTSVLSLTYRRYKDLMDAEAQTRESQIEAKRTEIALANLKAAQAQLIQSEKMASLGELTAGIAHEIQNPLNFVNNFSEVSAEMIEEMLAEVKKGNYEEVRAIADDVKTNLEKILHHGKRADGIVKGMLQHSRSSSGIKEPTDINALAEEYLRIAYHGLRAKDKSFNATMQTEYDQSIGQVNLIPQDIGRVVLNLIANAFYVVAEKKKQSGNGYEPTVSLITKKNGGNVSISVKDNGTGIPPKVLDKIFQPFFTTKPAGHGTGRGLSLSYDIVKAHGGELKVETREGEGSVFIIQLPF